jgi:CRP-like cAMP-binding protein
MLGAGQTFGEMSCLDGRRSSATLTAAEPTQVLEFAHDTLEGLCSERLSLAAHFWRNIAVELKLRLVTTNDLVAEYVDINRLLLTDAAFRDYYSKL